MIIDRIVEIETKVLVKISEYLSPIRLPKNPDTIDPIKGRNNNVNSILSFQGVYLFNYNC